MRGTAVFLLFLCLLLAAAAVVFVVRWPKKAKTIYEQGVAKVRSGDFQAGQKDLEAAVAKNPYNADAYYWIGVAWQGLDRQEEAVDAFTKALEVDAEIPAGAPEQAVPIQRELAEVWARRGAGRLALGHDNGAIDDLTRAINSNPNNAKAYWERGIAYFREGFPEIAEDDLRAAVLLDPNDVEALLAHARVSLETGDYLRAIKDARQAIRLRPESAEGYELMASGYMQKGEFSPVLQSFRKLARLDPEMAARLNRRWARVSPTFAPVEQGVARRLFMAAFNAPGPEPEEPARRPAKPPKPTPAADSPAGTGGKVTAPSADSPRP
jgi:tetratricopeptide (TPR) repeat protein